MTPFNGPSRHSLYCAESRVGQRSPTPKNEYDQFTRYMSSLGPRLSAQHHGVLIREDSKGHEGGMNSALDISVHGMWYSGRMIPILFCIIQWALKGLVRSGHLGGEGI